MAPGGGADEWHWVNLPGGNAEQPVVDLCDCTSQDAWHSGLSPEGAGPGRGCIVANPSRNTQEPVLRFVVGKRRNSMTSVGLGNPYMKKEPIDSTKSADALLTSDPEKSRTFWFLYDKSVGVAAMGCQGAPQADLCRLACRFRDAIGFRAEVCASLRYISLSSGKRPVSLRVVGAGAPPDVSIPRYRFDAVTWEQLPWEGASLVFEPPERHRALLERAQQILATSPIAPFYRLVDPRCLCLNVYRLLDPHRRGELAAPGEDGDALSWEACYEEVHRRLEATVLPSAPWTYWPLRLERADATSVALASTGPGCTAAMNAWSSSVQACTGLRNSATSSREVLTVLFAFEVFPVEGEEVTQVRRRVVRDINALLEQEWGTSEFRAPSYAVWQTHTDYQVRCGGARAAAAAALPAAPPAAVF